MPDAVLSASCISTLVILKTSPTVLDLIIITIWRGSKGTERRDNLLKFTEIVRDGGWLGSPCFNYHSTHFTSEESKAQEDDVTYVYQPREWSNGIPHQVCLAPDPESCDWPINRGQITDDHMEEIQGGPVYRLPTARHVSDAIQGQLTTSLPACPMDTWKRPAKIICLVQTSWTPTEPWAK